MATFFFKGDAVKLLKYHLKTILQFVPDTSIFIIDFLDTWTKLWLVLKINNNKMYTTMFFDKNWGNAELKNRDKNPFWEKLKKNISFHTSINR